MGENGPKTKSSKKPAALIAVFVCALGVLCFSLYFGNPAVRQYLMTGGRVKMITVDGIFNVRDIGGWKTSDGRRIKYGLIYRGSELDGIHGVNISSRGIEQMKDLGIRTEVDLRNSKEVKTAKYPLKNFASYDRFEIDPYMGVTRQKDLYQRAFRAVINGVLSDKPVYVHCWGGADRTGTVIALLEGSLGVSKKDVIRDYELTSLCASVGDRHYGKGDEGTRFKELVEYIEKNYEGATFSDKCSNLLLDIGITEKELADFRAKMLE